MSLNLFPARVPIGFIQDAEGVEWPVMASAEFLRQLAALFRRVGGANGLDISDLEILASFAQDPASEQVEAAANAGISAAFSPPPAAACCDRFDAEPSMAARMAELEKRLAETDLQLRVASNQLAMAAELMKRVEDVALGHNVTSLPMEFVELTKTVMALEIEAAFSPPHTDWEHPGQIGAKTVNSGAFSTISASGAATLTTLAVNTSASIGTSASRSGFRFTIESASGTAAAVLVRGPLQTTGCYLGASTSTTNVDFELWSERTGVLRFGNNNAEAARFSTTNNNFLLGTAVDGLTASGSIAIAQDLAHRGTKMGIFNTAPTTKQTVTGSRGGNAALASLLTALAAYGLLTDSSSA